MTCPQRIPDHILACRRSYQFRGVGEAADDGHAGEGGGGGGCEGAGEAGEVVGQGVRKGGEAGGEE